MTIEREIIYKVALPKDLKQRLETMIGNDTTDFTQKGLMDFHRQLSAFADEIKKAAGIYDAGPSSFPKRKAPYGTKKLLEILDWVQAERRFVSASEISVHFHIGKQRVLKYMAQLANEKKVKVIKGERGGLADPKIGPLPKALAVNG